MSYSNKAVMEVRLKQAGGDEFVVFEAPLHGTTNDVLGGWAALSIESNSERPNCKGKHTRKHDYDIGYLRFFASSVYLFVVLISPNGRFVYRAGRGPFLL